MVHPKTNLAFAAKTAFKTKRTHCLYLAAATHHAALTSAAKNSLASDEPHLLFIPLNAQEVTRCI